MIRHFFNTLLILWITLCILKNLVSCLDSNQCINLTNCDECIQTLGCVWCNNPELSRPNHLHNKQPRCNTQRNHETINSCSKEFLEIPFSSSKIMKNRPIIETGTQIHLAPQEVTLKLAIGQPQTIELTYQEAKDKKLDLYYLLDVSITMKENRETVQRQSEELARGLRKLTKDFFIGFGSFIDKPVIPFAGDYQLKGEGNSKTIPYAFKNNLKLTNNIQAFQREVRDTPDSENFDLPEGTFDALMQAIVCKEEIGWREGSRKLIVVATDGPFHIAGDGKIGGIVIPNDMQCHINKTHPVYDKATEYDYPSIGQINHVVIKNNVYVIFAIPVMQSNLIVLNMYKELSKWVEFSQVARLSADSADVVKLIQDLYKKISRNVTLVQSGYESPSSGLEVKYKVKCKPDEKWKDGNSCDNVNPSDLIRFKLELTLQKCPETNDRRNSLTFSTFELRGIESLLINLDFSNCECNCTKLYTQNKLPELVQEICNSNGKGLKCGLCECKNDFSGRNCQCSRLGGFDSFANKSGCIGQDGTECSGRGECKCGLCKCTWPYSGPLCDCDNINCYIERNGRPEECYGYERGRCSCGKCECREQFSGEECQCFNDQIGCKEPGKNSICNGQGACSCSKLSNTESDYEWKCSECNDGYSGSYCHICKSQNCADSSASKTQCVNSDLQDCLKCHLTQAIIKSMAPNKLPQCNSENLPESSISNCTSKMNILNTECAKLCVKDVDIRRYDEIHTFDVEVTSSISEASITGVACDLIYNESCTTTFAYSYQDRMDRLRLKVAILEISKAVCREAPSVFWYIVGINGAILLIGILTLFLWKLFTYFHDRVEYQKFEKERAASKWATADNPLYNNPMSTFENPSYRN